MKSSLVAPADEEASTAGVVDDIEEARGAPRSSSIILAGASFKTASLAFREALAARFARESMSLPRLLGVKEFVHLVTCSRIEAVFAAGSPDSAERAFLAWLSSTPGLEPTSIYLFRDLDAIAHLFRVAAGLDSMVLGEEQILSQVMGAGIAARTSKSSRGVLSSVFDASVNVGKRARVELKRTDESVSSMAIRFALGRLPRSPRNVLLIGTGKTSRLAARELVGAKVYVATRRTSIRPTRATVIPHRDLKRVAAKCDLIISATKHRGYVLKKGDLDGKRRVVLDLAFPRNVDPRLHSGKTEVFNLEDLARIFPPTPPGPDARRAEELVLEEAGSFARWLLASRQSSALSQVYQWAESTRREETDSALRRLPSLSGREKEVVEAMSRRLVSKLLAPATSFVKSSSPELPQERRLDVVKRIFDQGEQ